MKYLSFVAVAFAVSLFSTPAKAELTISLGVRETNFNHGGAAGAEGPIGANGGSSGGIVWINFDGQTFNLDGTWQTSTRMLDGSEPVSGFAGGSANGTLDGTWGTIEHVRILNSGGHADPTTIYIDDIIVNTSAGAVTLTDFEGFGLGSEVVFQEPSFSGSTAANLEGTNVSGISDAMAQSGTQSLQVDFDFVDSDPGRWIRLTTSNTANLGNPMIPFGAGNSISISSAAVPEPGSFACLALVACAGTVRRRKRQS